MPGQYFTQSFSSYILAMMLAMCTAQVLAEDTDLEKDKTYKTCCPGWCCPLKGPDDMGAATSSEKKDSVDEYEKSKSCCPGACCSGDEQKDKKKIDEIKQNK